MNVAGADALGQISRVLVDVLVPDSVVGDELGEEEDRNQETTDEGDRCTESSLLGQIFRHRAVYIELLQCLYEGRARHCGP